MSRTRKFESLTRPLVSSLTEALLGEDTQVGVYRGKAVFFSHISYNCPSLKLYGYGTEIQLKRAIDKKLGPGGPPNAGFKGFKMESRISERFGYKPRFVTPEQLKKLVDYYHMARGQIRATTKKDPSSYEMVQWAVNAFCKEHPEVKSMAAYKDLDAAVAP